MIGLVALTERMVLGTLRDDLPFAVVATVGFYVAFNLSLGRVIDTGDVSYAQYLLPAIVVQMLLIGVLTAVDRAARDRQSAFGTYLRTLPVPRVVPLMARMLYCVLRGVLVLIAAFAIGYVFGFRMVGGFGYTLAFIVLVLVFNLALSLGADAAGSWAGDTGIARSGASSQLLLIPQMLLVMLSTGMAPADSFPDWLYLFVKYQPISQVTESLRGLADGDVMVGNLATSAAWCFGLLVVFGATALAMQRRAG
jgi:ABC-2 type transport system permease protein